MDLISWKQHALLVNTVLSNNTKYLNPSLSLAKNFSVVKILEPYDIQSISLPHLGLPGSSLTTFTVGITEVFTDMLGVDDQVLSAQHDGNGPVAKVFLPHDVLLPEEASRERMRDTNIVRGKITKSVFVRGCRFTVQL